MITNENDRSVHLGMMSEELQGMMEQYFQVQCRYQSAIREVQTKLEILDNEFQTMHSRNPIHHMESRMKSLPSILEKLRRKGFPVSVEAAVRELTDIAGVRVICPYIDDIYTVAELLTRQDDVRVLRVRDYIKEPKPNGYRSLHLIVEIPVFLQEGKQHVPVEVQIRTIAMDFWAALEHELRYKGLTEVPEYISNGLSESAEDIARLDRRMQDMYHQVEHLISEGRLDTRGQ